MKENSKLFKYVILSLCLGFGISSCDLDVFPTDRISSGTFWANEQDAWSNLNTVYRALMPGTGIYRDSFTDDVYCQYSWESNGALFQRDGLDVGVGNQGNQPVWDFEGIRKANLFLQEVVNCPMDEDLRNRMMAEARLLRASRYLELTLMFGKVPVMTEVLPYDAPLVQRDPVERVRQFIIDELDAVSQILPASYNNTAMNEKGRVTRYAAIALKARAALYFGDYATAEQAAQQIMSSGQFSLFRVTSLNAAQQKEADEMDAFVDFAALGIDKDRFVRGMFSYESLWHTENAHPDNPEYIMSRQYMAAEKQADMVRYINMRPNQLGGWSSVTPTQNLVDAYWTADGRTPTIPSAVDRAQYYNQIRSDRTAAGGTAYSFVQANVIPTPDRYNYIQEFRNRDSRLYVSVNFPYKSWYETEYGDEFVYEWLGPGNNESITGFNFRKLVSLAKDWDEPNYDGAAGDYANVRYAEILLIFAEARTQTTGFDGSVQAALNDIRDRCGMPNVPTGLSREQGLELIQKERRIELAAEGFRDHDMTRYTEEYWRNAMDNVPITRPDGDVPVSTMSWSSRMRLKPIPQAAFNQNSSLAGDQNPGYQDGGR